MEQLIDFLTPVAIILLAALMYSRPSKRKAADGSDGSGGWVSSGDGCDGGDGGCDGGGGGD
jgi:uncharacterized membrane protein YgcG